jgi:hypothetical protein
MIPEDFISKWKASKLRERSASQSHFNDLCTLIGEPTPTEADPDGTFYTFDKGATKTGGGDGWADVWRRARFGWEYKGKHADLNAALSQLLRYSAALENPPLLIVSDMETIRIHTNFTNTVQKVYAIPLDDLRTAESRQILKWAFTNPDKLKPGVTREAITEQAAQDFAAIAQRLRDRGYEPQRVAHFVNRILFCMFAEDIGLLPERIFSRMLEAAQKTPNQFENMARDLFVAMRAGGRVGFEPIEWFNGGLFDSDDVLPLERTEIEQALRVSRLDWSAIDPSIFGTLFERGLDPDKRSQLGAHYTDRQSIMRIVEPVVIRPLSAEWESVKAQIVQALAKNKFGLDKGSAMRRPKKLHPAKELYARFLERLRKIRVLDPACGSGNFLYLALLGLKDLEHKINLEAETLGLSRQFPSVGPEALRGIEINKYAAELARVTIWIGEIQWMLRNGFAASRAPILRPLDNIECRDAVLNDDGSEATWPTAEVIVGNPPFLGDRKIIGTLGEDSARRLRAAYKGRVPAGADLVTYWFAKAGDALARGTAQRAGLVATNSIRGGQNREVLKELLAKGSVVFDAWSDEGWVLDGAAVRVSIVCLSRPDDPVARTSHLDGKPVDMIYADLTGSTNETRNLDATRVGQLSANSGFAFQGIIPRGSFSVPGDVARRWLQEPLNPNGQPNAEILRPYWNGIDVTRRPRDQWIVTFSNEGERDASLFESPFKYLKEVVQPERQSAREESARENWWLFWNPRPEMMTAIGRGKRYIATPRVAKHRLFVWMDLPTWPDCQLVVIARDDDVTFGILHSRFHEIWTLRMCSWLGVGNDPRYTPKTTFRTFPFPQGLAPNIPPANFNNPAATRIADAARRLHELRAAWLNPADLVDVVPEVATGFPDRLIAKNDSAAAKLKKRTLTNLYNEMPEWLSEAHRELDSAVGAAYGIRSELPDDQIMNLLLELHDGHRPTLAAE